MLTRKALKRYLIILIVTAKAVNAGTCKIDFFFLDFFTILIPRALDFWVFFPFSSLVMLPI